MTISTGKWTKVREIDVSGGFAPDPDWVATNDVNGAMAAGRHLLHPSKGTEHRMYALELRDAQGALMSDATATATVELITYIGELNEPEKLIPPRASVDIAGNGTKADDLPVYKSQVTVRVTSFSTALSPETLNILLSLG